MRERTKGMIGGALIGMTVGAVVTTALDTAIIRQAVGASRNWQGIAQDWKSNSDRFEKIAQTSTAAWKDCVEYYGMFDLTLKPKPKGADL